MLKRRNHIWEAGCADTFGSWLVATAKDFDPVFVADVRNRMDKRWRFDCEQHDLLVSPFPGQFDGAYALDVIEHIPAEKERSFVGNLVNSPTPEGVLILGWRSLETQACASPPSEAGHVNGKTGKMMRSLLEHFFCNVFVFSMNDEVVHTGYYPMAHYIIGVGRTRRSPGREL